MQGYYYYKPITAGDAKKFLGTAESTRETQTVRDTDINRYLDAIGIKHANAGYKYLMTLISTGIRYPSLLMNISELYREVSKLLGKSEGCIERSVRYSIKENGQSNKEFI